MYASCRNFNIITSIEVKELSYTQFKRPNCPNIVNLVEIQTQACDVTPLNCCAKMAADFSPCEFVYFRETTPLVRTVLRLNYM